MNHTLLKILYVDVYRQAETFTQTAPYFFLGLQISGLEYMQLYHPDGKLLKDLHQPDMPVLTLLPPGIKIRFKYGPDRENWIIHAESSEFCYHPLTHQLLWQDLEIPMLVPLPIAELESMRRQFRRIRALFQSGFPRDQISAHLYANAILAEFFVSPNSSGDDSTPARRLKNAIDNDLHFRFSLTELSKQIGGSVNHLRIAFQQQYELSPVEYRKHLRLQRILHMLTHSELSIKEIADIVGMKHPTHLNALLRETCGKTPSELKSRKIEVEK